MNRETSRTSASMAPERLLRRVRSSGRRAGQVKVGHDKMGRAKYRAEGTMAVRRGHAHFAEPEGAVDEGKYPNLAALRRGEHAQHVRRAMEMGMTRKEAQRHAREDERDGRLGARRPRQAGRMRTGTAT